MICIWLSSLSLSLLYVVFAVLTSLLDIHTHINSGHQAIRFSCTMYSVVKMYSNEEEEKNYYTQVLLLAFLST